MENPNFYIPIAASLISLFSAIFVALMSIRNARKIEDYKSKENYYNFKIKQLMDEYYKYNPIVSISGVDPKDAVRPFESRFADCRLSILRVRPLLSENALSELDVIEAKYNKIILDQYNASMHNEVITKVDAGDYIKMLDGYMQKGHKILQKEILDIRRRFEVVS